MSTEAKSRVVGGTVHYTYNYLYAAAKHALLLAARGSTGQPHGCLLSIVACAFTLEAYLNHLGESLFEYWPQMERLSPEAKLNIICSRLKLKPDFGTRPYSSFLEAIKIRNRAAHSRTE